MAATRNPRRHGTAQKLTRPANRPAYSGTSPSHIVGLACIGAPCRKGVNANPNGCVGNRYWNIRTVTRGQVRAHRHLIACRRSPKSLYQAFAETAFGKQEGSLFPATKPVSGGADMLGLLRRKGRIRSAERVEAHLSVFRHCNLLSARLCGRRALS